MSDIEKKRKPRFTITAVLVFGSATATLIAVGVVLFLGISGAVKNTSTLLYSQAEQRIDSLVNQIDQDLAPIYNQTSFVAKQVKNGMIDPRNTEEWARYLEALPSATPQVVRVGFINQDYLATIFSIRPGNFIQINLDRFPEVRKTMAEIVGPMPPQWYRPTLSPRGGFIELLIWVPLYVNDEYIGVYFEAVAAQSLTNTLTKQETVSGVTPFILYNNNSVLVHRNVTDWQAKQQTPGLRPPPFATGPENSPLPEIDQLDDPVLANFWKAERAFIDKNSGKTLTRVTQAVHDDTRFIYVFRYITDYGPKPWTVGVYLSEDLNKDLINNIRNFTIAGIIVLILSVGMAITVGKLTARPVLRLARAASAFESGNLNAVPYVESSRLKEMDEAATSFNHMIQGMKERENMRDLFGKYVPKRVAEKLLATDGALEPQSAEATILFVDLAGFTTLSEKLEPPKIVEILNTYFSAVVDIIEANEGVITQFQGDAILAIFNVPVPVENHAAKAIKTAKEIHRAVNNAFYGGQKLSCRIGINTGSVIAGNVGAQARLNYTVHGDAVNLAARLEQLNKEFGTGILVSESTVAQTDGENFKPQGEVEIRGKTNKVTVYSVTD